MRDVYMLPTPSQAALDLTQSINTIVVKLSQYLPEYGYRLVETPQDAVLTVGHAGTPDGLTRLDVSHLSGLYPTAHHNETQWHWAINARVIETIRHAKATTVPSHWVAEIIQRDMGFTPDIIGWGIDAQEWNAPTTPHSPSYVLWAKPRADAVCDPSPMVKLAAICPQQLFLTTFIDRVMENKIAQNYVTPNIKAVGRVPFLEMKGYVQNAAVYMSTTKETFGLGVLESLASGVPVIGYNEGAITEIVRHGKEGYLVERDDIQGLKRALEWCLKYRHILSVNCRKRALEFTWQRTAQAFAQVYDRVLSDTPRPHRIADELYRKDIEYA